MVNEVICPNCHKLNDINKFCIHCGHKLLDDEQIRLFLDNPEAYCLNCGRRVEKGQGSCECGYELKDINCPDCNAKNAYANKFCTVCGKKLWTSDVYHYMYPERLFEEHLFRERLPNQLKNTSLEKRSQRGIGKNLSQYLSSNLAGQLKSVDKNLIEICSRWKIVSPNSCISCHGIVKADEYSCSKCQTTFDKRRVYEIKAQNYAKPAFADGELKWTPKSSASYLPSLAPAIGESLFEYRERLKWEFAENNKFKKIIMNAISREKEQKERKRQYEEQKRQMEELKKREMEYIRQYGGGYCGFSCRHYYEEYFDSHGGIVGDIDSEGYVEYYCNLGHTIADGKYCKDYER